MRAYLQRAVQERVNTRLPKVLLPAVAAIDYDGERRVRTRGTSREVRSGLPSTWDEAEQVSRVLSLPPSERSPGQLASLFELLQCSSLFRQIRAAPDVERSLCQVIGVRWLMRGEVLFEQGEECRHDGMYLVLRGSLSSHVKDTELQPGEDDDIVAAFGKCERMLLQGDLVGHTALEEKHTRHVFGTAGEEDSDADSETDTDDNKDGPAVLERQSSRASILSASSGDDTVPQGNVHRKSTVVARETSVLVYISFAHFLAFLRDEAKHRLLNGYECVRSVLALPPRSRSAPAITAASQALKHLKFFESLSPALIWKLCRVMKCRKYGVGSIVCEQGEPGSEFYIVLSGGVSIHVSKNKSSAQDSKKKQAQKEREARRRRKQQQQREGTMAPWDDTDESSGSDSAVSEMSDSSVDGSHQPVISTSDDHRYRRIDNFESMQPQEIEERFGEQVVVLTAGHAFGEGSIIDDVPRGASGLCHVPTEVLVVGKRDYLHIIGRRACHSIEDVDRVVRVLRRPASSRTEQEVAMVVDRLKSIRFFHDMPLTVRHFAAKHMQYETADADTVVFQEGDQGEHLFIVLTGSVALHKKRNQSTEKFVSKARAIGQSLAAFKRSSFRKKKMPVAEASSGSSADSLPKLGEGMPDVESSSMRRRSLLVRQKSGGMSDAEPDTTTSNESRRSSRRSLHQRTSTIFHEPASTRDVHFRGGHEIVLRSSRGSPPARTHRRRGSVSMWRTKEEEDQIQEADRAIALAEDPNTPAFSFLEAEDSEFEADLVRLYGPRRRVAQPGDTFGESSLLQNQARFATVVTLEPTEFITLTKMDFMRVVRRAKMTESGKQADWVAFLKSVDLFSRAAELQLLRLAYYIEERSYSRNTFLTRQGDPSEDVYLVVSGVVKVVREVDIVPITKAARKLARIEAEDADEVLDHPDYDVVELSSDSSDEENEETRARRRKKRQRQRKKELAEVSKRQTLHARIVLTSRRNKARRAAADKREMVLTLPQQHGRHSVRVASSLFPLLVRAQASSAGDSTPSLPSSSKAVSLSLDLALYGSKQICGLETLAHKPRSASLVAHTDEVTVIVLKRSLFVNNQVPRGVAAKLRELVLERRELYRTRLVQHMRMLLHRGKVKDGSGPRSVAVTPKHASPNPRQRSRPPSPDQRLRVDGGLSPSTYSAPVSPRSPRSPAVRVPTHSRTASTASSVLSTSSQSELVALHAAALSALKSSSPGISTPTLLSPSPTVQGPRDLHLLANLSLTPRSDLQRRKRALHRRMRSGAPSNDGRSQTVDLPSSSRVPTSQVTSTTEVLRNFDDALEDSTEAQEAALRLAHSGYLTKPPAQGAHRRSYSNDSAASSVQASPHRGHRRTGSGIGSSVMGSRILSSGSAIASPAGSVASVSSGGTATPSRSATLSPHFVFGPEARQALRSLLQPGPDTVAEGDEVASPGYVLEDARSVLADVPPPDPHVLGRPWVFAPISNAPKGRARTADSSLSSSAVARAAEAMLMSDGDDSSDEEGEGTVQRDSRLLLSDAVTTMGGNTLLVKLARQQLHAQREHLEQALQPTAVVNRRAGSFSRVGRNMDAVESRDPRQRNAVDELLIGGSGANASEIHNVQEVYEAAKTKSVAEATDEAGDDAIAQAAVEAAEDNVPDAGGRSVTPTPAGIRQLLTASGVIRTDPQAERLRILLGQSSSDGEQAESVELTQSMHRRQRQQLQPHHKAVPNRRVMSAVTRRARARKRLQVAEQENPDRLMSRSQSQVALRMRRRSKSSSGLLPPATRTRGSTAPAQHQRTRTADTKPVMVQGSRAQLGTSPGPRRGRPHTGGRMQLLKSQSAGFAEMMKVQHGEETPEVVVVDRRDSVTLPARSMKVDVNVRRNSARRKRPKTTAKTRKRKQKASLRRQDLVLDALSLRPKVEKHGRATKAKSTPVLPKRAPAQVAGLIHRRRGVVRGSPARQLRRGGQAAEAKPVWH